MKIYTIDTNTYCMPNYLDDKTEDEIKRVWIETHIKDLLPLLKVQVREPLPWEEATDGAKVIMGRLNIVTYE